MRKRFFAALAAVLLALSLAACQEDPDGTIVVHKDMDNLISKAQESSPEKVEAGDIVDEVSENYETYQTTLEDESLNVKVNINAQVDVPQVDTLSVYRVRQKPFTQEFVDKVREVLMGDEQLYEARALWQMDATKTEIEDMLAWLREDLKYQESILAGGYENDPELDDFQRENYPEELWEANMKQLIGERQDEINKYQEAYENAANEIDLTGYENDGQLITQEMLLEKYPQFDRDTVHYADDETLMAITDGSDGQYKMLEVSNSEKDSNYIAFTTSPGAYQRVYIPYSFTEFDPENWPNYGASESVPENLIPTYSFSQGSNLAPYENDKTTITEEEAMAVAEAFLEEIGVTDFAFEDGGLFNELVENYGHSSASTLAYREYYIFRFRRMLDGVMLTQTSGMKYDNPLVGQYENRIWPAEVIELRINDAGIAGFNYSSPIEVYETVTANAALKTFADVKNTAESMLCIVNADEMYENLVEINRVRISYSRISERDDFASGLIVPVWSFEGRKEFSKNGAVIGAESGSYLDINAIDGSIIDGGLGY